MEEEEEELRRHFYELRSKDACSSCKGDACQLNMGLPVAGSDKSLLSDACGHAQRSVRSGAEQAMHQTSKLKRSDEGFLLFSR